MKSSKKQEYTDIQEAFSSEASNPLKSKFDNSKICLSDYTQEIPRPRFDSDLSSVAELIRVFNNMAPQKMPEYNFNIDEINGERFYKPDKSLLLVRDYDSDLIRDYYFKDICEAENITVKHILEHDKNTGRLRCKIEPIIKNGIHIRTNITIFDEKINNKYVIMQIGDNGNVNNITEFSGKGKSFRTLFRDNVSCKPVRYIQGDDNEEKQFEMLDCIIASNGNIVKIKKYTSNKETCIDYTENSKKIKVKSK